LSTIIKPARQAHPLPYAALFFDADGTLRRCTIPGQPCPNKPGEYELLPKVEATLALYDWGATGCSIISNQAGIALGYLCETTARFLLQETLALATDCPIGPGQVLLCPHALTAGCACRKPAPGMLIKAETWWYSRGLLHGPGQCLFVGDMDSDREAAERAGIVFCWAKDFFGWEQEPLPPQEGGPGG
jgi:D-glycero-D-manno-heptose 1,7-bisphosphate phosphatase